MLSKVHVVTRLGEKAGSLKHQLLNRTIRNEVAGKKLRSGAFMCGIFVDAHQALQFPPTVQKTCIRGQLKTVSYL